MHEWLPFHMAFNIHKQCHPIHRKGKAALFLKTGTNTLKICLITTAKFVYSKGKKHKVLAVRGRAEPPSFSDQKKYVGIHPSLL